MNVGTSPQIDGDRLQIAIDAAGVGIWDHDLINNKLVWSVHSYRLFGITNPYPITSDTFMEGLHPDDRETTQQIVNKALIPQYGGTYDTEFRTIGLQDGIQRWIRATGKAYFDANGTPFRFVGTVSDITARKAAEQKLEESEQRFRNMADNVPVKIWITNPDGDCTYLNKRWLTYTGQTIEEGLRLGWADAVHPEERENAKQAFIAANKERQNYMYEYRLRSKDGQYRWMIDSANPRFNESGEYLGYIGSVLDISDRRKAEEALLFRSAQLEAQNEASADGLLLVDTMGKILSFNQRFLEIWNMPQQIVAKHSDREALEYAKTQVTDPETFINPVHQLYANSKEASYDELRFKDGKIVERSGRAVTGQDGTNYGLLWQFRDVTERRAEQQELKLRTAMLEAQNEGSPLGILVIDNHKNVYYLNKRYADIFDLPDYLLPKPTREELLEFFSKTIVNYPAFMEKIQYLYNNPVSGTQDVIHLTSGKIIERYGYPIKSEDGLYYGWTWQFREITEQRKAEESLHQKNELLESLIQEFKFVTDFMPQMVWATQPDGYHDFFNKQWYNFTGLDYETTKDKGWSLVLHPEDYERTLQIWQHSLDSGEVYQVEYRMRRHDGVYIWFLGRAVPMYDAHGNILKWFGTCTDIDDQRKASDLLELKVAERTRQLQEVNKNLERSNAELEQFAYVASHDLQEPLRKIRTFANRLESELQHEDLSKSGYYIERIWHSSSRMQELIKDLLNFSRLSQTNLEDVKQTNLNEIVKDVTEDLELTIMQKSATLNIGVLPLIEASALQMSQLFYNLLNNALKFSRTGVQPEISIECTAAAHDMIEAHQLPPEAGPYYQITVSDNGIGFKNEYAEQIFTVFQRLHHKDAYEGTGIGLALCKKVVTNHKGAIFTNSREGSGATFYIILPRHQHSRAKNTK
jgi:PAS domain S-box-containing protein